MSSDTFFNGLTLHIFYFNSFRLRYVNWSFNLIFTF
jgi:hypothetical protein